MDHCFLHRQTTGPLMPAGFISALIMSQLCASGRSGKFCNVTICTPVECKCQLMKLSLGGFPSLYRRM